MPLRTTTPLFRKTSCGVAYAHGMADYNGHWGVRELCDICPSLQRQRCADDHTTPSPDAMDKVLAQLGYETPYVKGDRPMTGTPWYEAPLVALDLEGSGAQDRDQEAILERRREHLAGRRHPSSRSPRWPGRSGGPRNRGPAPPPGQVLTAFGGPQETST